MLRVVSHRKIIIITSMLVLLVLFGEKGYAKTKVSGPEIRWAIAHPFIAMKAKKISERAIYLTDSIEKIGLLADRSGGQLDAFKHTIWMALLAQSIKPKKAKKLGMAHEKYNYKMYRKGIGGGDLAASEMDLWNNDVGLIIGTSSPDISENKLVEIVITAIKQGKMKIVKKDLQGKSLDCEGKLIDNSSLKTWNNNRCLVSSDYKYNL